MFTGVPKPKSNRLGVDFAGTEEAVGRDITQFRPGDEVFGARDGAFAEYVCVRNAVAPKPANLTLEQAAAVPVAALTALQGLRDKGQIQPGQKVLINGASGGVGTFAVQIAKAFGAEVTGVCSSRNVDLVRSIGADHPSVWGNGCARYEGADSAWGLEGFGVLGNLTEAPSIGIRATNISEDERVAMHSPLVMRGLFAGSSRLPSSTNTNAIGLAIGTPPTLDATDHL